MFLERSCSADMLLERLAIEEENAAKVSAKIVDGSSPEGAATRLDLASGAEAPEAVEAEGAEALAVAEAVAEAAVAQGEGGGCRVALQALQAQEDEHEPKARAEAAENLLQEPRIAATLPRVPALVPLGEVQPRSLSLPAPQPLPMANAQ